MIAESLHVGCWPWLLIALLVALHLIVLPAVIIFIYQGEPSIPIAGTTAVKEVVTISLFDLVVAPSIKAIPIKLTDFLHDEITLCPDATSPHSLQDLIDTQNDTIAMLAGQLVDWRCWYYSASGAYSSVYPACPAGIAINEPPEINLMQKQLCDLRADLERVCGSLGTSIQASLDSRLPSMFVELASKDEVFSLAETVHLIGDRLPAHAGILADLTKFVTKEDMMDHAQDNKTLVLSAHQDAIQVAGDTCKGAIADLFDKLPCLFQKSKAECNAYTSKLENQLNDLSASLDAKLQGLRNEFRTSSDVKLSLPMAAATAVSVASSAPLASVDAPTTFNIGDRVRLFGLQTISLNNMLGTILSHDIASQRFGIRLLSGQEKSVKADRLLLYTPADEDRCPRCKEYINLNSFPPCDCTSSSIEF